MVLEPSWRLAPTMASAFQGTTPASGGTNVILPLVIVANGSLDSAHANAIARMEFFTP
jgi:hypothetical protein